MRRYFPFDTYTPVDQADKQPGIIKLKITPRTVQAFDLQPFNVLDIDCYGDPFEIWSVVAPRIAHKTAVFLTFGHLGLGGSSLSYFLREQNGIPKEWPIPVDRELNILCGRRYFMASMCKVNASMALVVDHERVSYYGALVHGKTR